ncbi:MAG: transcription termination factor Rho [Phycisphaerae bacterium]
MNDPPAKTEDVVSGVFEASGESGGHLRNPDVGYQVRPGDIVVPAVLRRTMGLRGGEMVVGRAKPGSRSARGRARELAHVESINGRSPEHHLDSRPFEDLTAVDPGRHLQFETSSGSLSMRIVDLMTPIGFGQRGLIVAPPRTGKTILLQQMADGIATNHPDAHLIVLLVDERPEEVTDMRRKVRGEVAASSNDKAADSHIRLTRVVIEKAKRLVEGGQDVVILLDSLTRLGRAFNTTIKGSRRIMSGGLDAAALNEPKGIFGAARNVEEGGSLTIVASALIETGSRMDEVIFNEFKGTGNMEIMLSREMANKRLWPAIDLNLSGTRKEERLLTPEALEVAHKIRRTLSGKDPSRAMELLLQSLERFPSNSDFIQHYAERPLR